MTFIRVEKTQLHVVETLLNNLQKAEPKLK